jgi:hypothetical protein
MPDVLTVLIDTEQRRVATPRISLTAAKFDLNGLDFSNTYIDPITGTVMLRPACLTDAWDTSNTGVTLRLALSDFGITASATEWQAANNRGAGAVRLVNQSGLTGGVRNSISTTATWTKNRSWYVSFYVYNVEGQKDGVYYECGWGNDGDGSTGVSLRFRVGGIVEVYKTAVLVGTYTVSNATQPNTYASWMVIPCRRRDLLIINIETNDGFVHTFTDIAETATNPIILPAAKFWSYVPYGSANIEVAPLQFPASGYVTSVPISLMIPPPTGATLEARVNTGVGASVTNAMILGDSPFYGTIPDVTNKVSAFAVVKTDGTAYTPDGTIRDVLAKVTLVGNGSYTPFLYGVHAAYSATFANTSAAEEFDLTPYIVDNPPPQLTVPDDPGGVSFTFSLIQPETLNSTYVDKLLTLGNRPVKVKIGSVVVLDGVMMEPVLTDGVYDAARRLSCEVRDRTHLAQTLQFRERIPLDGLLLSSASPSVLWSNIVSFLYFSFGIPLANIDQDTIGYTLPVIPGNLNDDPFNAIIDVGGNPYDELARLVSTYAAGFLWGIKPGASGLTAMFKDPDTLSSTPDYTLYRTGAAAVAASKPARDVYFTYSERPLPLDANEVRVSGYDPRAKKAIQVYKVDTASQTVTTAPASRPDNWAGAPLILGITDPRITSIDAATRVVNAVYPRVTARYWISNFTSELLFKSAGVPIWRGDLVSLNGRRNVRISAINVTFHREDANTVAVRSCSYTGGTLLNRGGSDPDGIARQQAAANFNRSIVFPGGDFIATKTSGNTVAI